LAKSLALAVKRQVHPVQGYAKPSSLFNMSEGVTKQAVRPSSLVAKPYPETIKEPDIILPVDRELPNWMK